MTMHDPQQQSTDEAAERALAALQRQGFDAAQADAQQRQTREVNAANTEATLLRSLATRRLVLTGLVDGRRASTELGDFSDAAIADAVALLWQAAQAAPQDPANALSAGQQASVMPAGEGAAAADDAAAEAAVLADSLAGLLAWRAEHTPTVLVEESFVARHRQWSRTLSSGGSDLRSRQVWCEAQLMGTAREGAKASSFNYTGGRCARLDDGLPLVQRFGFEALMRELARQVHSQSLAQALGGRFTGAVVLTPATVADLLGWLLGQLGDQALIAGSSLYRERVGQAVASPLLSLHSRWGEGQAPGVAPFSADGFVAPQLSLLQQGVLQTLTPTLYGARKTGLAHRPVAEAGWAIDASALPLQQLIAGVPRGALVGRLSMGRPAANGDFSGVIKNSFAIVDGEVGPALSEVMISGNMAQMLRAVDAVSAERIDTGTLCLPWLRVGGLHFS